MVCVCVHKAVVSVVARGRVMSVHLFTSRGSGTLNEL